MEGNERRVETLANANRLDMPRSCSKRMKGRGGGKREERAVRSEKWQGRKRMCGSTQPSAKFSPPAAAAARSDKSPISQSSRLASLAECQSQLKKELSQLQTLHMLCSSPLSTPVMLKKLCGFPRLCSETCDFRAEF